MLGVSRAGVGCLEVICIFKQKAAYKLRISDSSSDVCSSDLGRVQYESPGFAARSKSRRLVLNSAIAPSPVRYPGTHHGRRPGIGGCCCGCAREPPQGRLRLGRSHRPRPTSGTSAPPPGYPASEEHRGGHESCGTAVISLYRYSEQTIKN